MVAYWRPELRSSVIAVCVSNGGIPKRPVFQANVTINGIDGDGHAHGKHNRLDRAVSLFDIEILHELVREGFPLAPGLAGENLTLRGVFVQRMEPGTLLQVGEVLLRLEQPRKPCYVLDAIDPQLKHAMEGRCGYMATVLRGGTIWPEMAVHRREDESNLPANMNGWQPRAASPVTTH